MPPRMRNNLFGALLAAAVVSSTAASAQAAPASPAEARIPFASEVLDFRPDGRDAILIEDSHRRWYRGTFVAPCLDLPFTNAIGFEDRGTGGIDRFATIYARGWRCQLNSFVEASVPAKHAPR